MNTCANFSGNYEQQYFSLKKMCGLTVDNTITTSDNGNRSSTLHLVLIANTYDPTVLAQVVSVMETNLKNEFRQVANALDITFTTFYR